MEFSIGVVLALVVAGFARTAGLDRDRAFYVAVAITVASYYVLFAVMGGSTNTLVVESIVMIAFVLVALAGFKANLWLVVACLGAHGVLDALHDCVYANPGVPGWWPVFCLAFDVTAASFLAWLLLREKLAARPRSVTRPALP
jgi:hypothetical protein